MSTLTDTNESEYDRLKKLSELDLDYSDLQKEFEHLNILAVEITGAEISLINLLDNYTQWTIASHGAKIHQMPREEAVCSFTIQDKTPFEVKHLDKDTRFMEMPYVAGNDGLNLTYYLGIPLTLPTGENIGALCVLDKNEKQISEKKIAQLKLLAKVVVDQLILKNEVKNAQKQMAEALYKRKKVSHDVRSPITGIIGIASLAITQDIEPEEQKENFEMIEKSGRQLLRLADEILYQEQEKDEGVSGQIRLVELGEKILNLYRPQAESKNISLFTKIDPKYKGIEVNKENLLQIIGNLIANAIKFSPEKGRVTLSLILQTSGDVPILEIKVKDTGKGLTEEKIREIMEGKVSSTPGSAGETGFGLGLKLLNTMVKKMKGSLEIEKTQNTGSLFKVRIPQPQTFEE